MGRPRTPPWLLLGLLAAALLASCEAPVTLGTACGRASDCVAPLTCALGRCRTECTENRDCPLATTCVLDTAGRGSCTLVDDPGCGPTSPCPESLLCVDRACVNGCTTVAECPPDAQCVPASDGRARCVRGEAVDASVDASVGDAGGDADDAGGDCLVGPGCDPIVQIGTGNEHTCARTESGAIWCWGGNQASQLTRETGLCREDYQCSPVPVRVRFQTATASGEIAGALALAVGNYTSCAILPHESAAMGQVLCWGNGGSELTPGHAFDPHQPALPVVLDDGSAELPPDALRVVVSETFALTEHADGAHYGWGDDALAQLQGSDRASLYAVPVTPLSGHVGALSIGGAHGCGVLGAGASGAVWCWGENDLGQSALPTAGPIAMAPQEVGLPAAPTKIAAGRGHTCACLDDGSVWCWGNGNVDGLDGRPSTSACTDVGDGFFACAPQAIFRPSGVSYASLSATTANTACALDTAGRVWCWGQDAPMVAVNGVRPERIDPTLEGARAVSVGGTSACLLTQDGDVWCWGQDYNGQLGRGTFGEVPDPTPRPVVWPRG